MPETNEYRPGTAFINDIEKGISVPEEQYLAEQALKEKKQPPDQTTVIEGE